MSRYFEALQKNSASLREGVALPVRTVRLALVPTVQPVPAELARNAGLYHLAEQLSASASVSDDARVFVAGCNPGDGAYCGSCPGAGHESAPRHTTALVDAHLQHPAFRISFVRNDIPGGEGRSTTSLIRTTGLARLELLLNSLGQTSEQLIEEIRTVLPRFRTAVFDLGVPRLDPSLLRLVRPNDLVLLVARYGQTERRHLLASVRAFSAANHPAVGVIFNAVSSPIPAWLRWIVRIGG